MLEALSRAAFEADIPRLDARTAAHRGWQVNDATYPTFDVTFTHPTMAALRLRLTCIDWDDLPPSVELLDAAGAQVTQAPPCVGYIFHPNPHPITARFFVCMRGTREYHTHFSHVGEAWDNYRGKPGLDLLGITHQIWHNWKRAVG